MNTEDLTSLRLNVERIAKVMREIEIQAQQGATKDYLKARCQSCGLNLQAIARTLREESLDG